MIGCKIICSGGKYEWLCGDCMVLVVVVVVVVIMFVFFFF